jgi:hypothetical protein
MCAACVAYSFQKNDASHLLNFIKDTMPFMALLKLANLDEGSIPSDFTIMRDSNPPSLLFYFQSCAALHERLFYIMCLCNPQLKPCAALCYLARSCIRSHYVI